ncbi:MAG: nitrous oxide reductase accessory protein NosL [Saprospiraceae bacterium]|jgi:copper chaperone NosL|nr:nitrous oxide reductase accessory protein NosL [Saprospiraceae bacterium]MBK7608587.1 nitrous oxide reductase accessory protein NosL [Saprospiraceae bacterium]MBK8776387.1 nitrous oxide reductase accessory protein NosL [Saprospiraceae bacterium]MBK9678630.1 nitrous oxide reductase accessory protein NosL [Saprospiraceae bacterium]MBK9931065.1 nitrous oxide reductase accessory protein NosL [Saprospiraceae bacterium]
MKDTLSFTSRILVAFASGALIAIYFLPAWRIDLFAPQYPEGLTMYIWINKLSGDVDIINGLNHYIGMKHISADMFPEFKFMSYVVAFFIALGLTAAITGKRKILLSYILLSLVGGLFVFYDLYKWGYEYGHNLDPKAAIQVPGLSYQPPVFGHKRLLNFDAYSFPDVAGWIVFGAVALASLVWLFEWYKHKSQSPKMTALLLIISTMLISCKTSSEPFVIGVDACQVCKMGIVDTKYGGELITKKGKLLKFDDIGCMIKHLKTNSSGSIISQALTMDYLKSNHFIPVDSAWFLISPDLKSPMNSHVAAFADLSSVQNHQTKYPGEILKWDALLSKPD